ncbi:hypothetical protein UO65_0158 [Actinokineospora spheciospongiae]|uniref:Uncharacterized protein n=1 Tax=Actinokineospora spheciospongiae TaxID=909613 RepID=W7J6A1_9PSEU|nr:hypothetical protein [Actinokineospora spheciospongiae]EWC64551.1 hypothetical protein UO65_0158 [Actinokineospora spheciospongiae]
MSDPHASRSWCPDCAVPVGRPHIDRCDVARCLRTGLQRLDCEAAHDCGTDTWTGRWPGEADCERLGWMIGPDFPDLNRLYTQATWNPTTHHWDAHA